MSNQNRGLGRGLSALLGINDLAQPQEKEVLKEKTPQPQPQVVEKKEKQCDANLPFQFTVLKTNLLVCFFNAG